MKTVTISLIVVVLTVNATAKPTFDLIADIMHDLVHDPSVSHGQPQYVQTGSYSLNDYRRPDYVHGGHGYNQKSFQRNSPYGYDSNSPYVGYSPPIEVGHYGPNAVYDNQGYYKGPPYSNNYPNGYNYNNGHNGYNGY